MIDFDKHIIERADAKYAHMRRCAEMDSFAHDDASRLEASLRDYLPRDAPQVPMMFATTRAPNGERI
jgi:hypothetical protein